YFRRNELHSGATGVLACPAETPTAPHRRKVRWAVYSRRRPTSCVLAGTGREPVTFANCYADATRAQAYATLEFKNTYHLAYRDIPAILGEHVRGRKSLDFGCGTGRSTRFLRQHGFEVTGVDIAEDMIRKARELDPSGDYRLIQSNLIQSNDVQSNDVPGDDLSAFQSATYDLVLAAFTF